MTWRNRIYLCPCDYLVFNHHCLMKRNLQGEYQCLMVVDVQGHVDPERIRRALARAMAAHPATIAGLRVSRVWGTPYWRLRPPTETLLRAAAATAHRFTDLRNEPSSSDRLQQLMNANCGDSWDHAAGPQIRLDQFALADGRTRFCLRWPHFLTDAEGAQLFLRHLSRLDQVMPSNGNAVAPPSPQDPPADHEFIDPLAGLSMARRISLARRALAVMSEPQQGRINPLHPQRFPPATGHRLLHRRWETEAVRTMHALAKSTTPPGPGLYARHLIASTLRALHRIYVQKGVTTDAYVITLPVRAPLPEGAAARPVRGNYLVPLTISGRRDLIGDRRALGEDLLRQYRRFLEEHMGQLWCSVMWALSRLRLSMYQSLLSLQLGYVPLASGFSYYGEIDSPIREIGGAKVTNIWGAAIVATPPGWNPAFSRFGDQLNLALAYACPAVPDELARQYMDYIEEEMFARA